MPGAFELPQAARCAAETGRFDAIICLGCVIRGETPHFEYISSAVAHGIMEAAGETGIPIAFGVLTTDTEAQAEERAGSGRDNKGWEAAAAGIEMAVLFRATRTRTGARHPAIVRIRAGHGARRLMTAGDPSGRRRAREAALQMLYQSEVGRASADEAIATYWPAHEPRHELPDTLREFANTLVRGTLERVTEIDAHSRGACARTGASSAWR